MWCFFNEYDKGSLDHSLVSGFLNFVLMEKIIEHANNTTNTEVVEQYGQDANQLPV